MKVSIENPYSFVEMAYELLHFEEPPVEVVTKHLEDGPYLIQYSLLLNIISIM